jgi:beta-fructofuranosidase
MPREHFVANFHRIVNFKKIKNPEPFTIVSHLRGKNGASMVTVRTMGVRPIREMNNLRQHWFHPAEVLPSLGKTHRLQDIGYTGLHFEIHAVFKFPKSLKQGKFGFQIRASPDAQERTGIYYDIGKKLFVIDKSLTSFNKSIDATSEMGHFELFTILDSVGEEEVETLSLRIFVDNSIVEVSLFF